MFDATDTRRAACDALVRDAGTDISRALTPEVWEGAAWSAAQCRTALRAIVNSPHAAVPVRQLAAQLEEGFSLFGFRLWGGGGSPLKALASMHEQNLLQLRSFQSDARDIEAAAFGAARDEEVYTLPSAAHLLAARRRLSES